MANELIYGNQCRLQNGYDDWGGGCLDTDGWATAGRQSSGGFAETDQVGTAAGSAYSVCTNAYYHRVLNVGLWKASPAQWPLPVTLESAPHAVAPGVRPPRNRAESPGIRAPHQNEHHHAGHLRR